MRYIDAILVHADGSSSAEVLGDYEGWLSGDCFIRQQLRIRGRGLLCEDDIEVEPVLYRRLAPGWSIFVADQDRPLVCTPDECAVCAYWGDLVFLSGCPCGCHVGRRPDYRGVVRAVFGQK